MKKMKKDESINILKNDIKNLENKNYKIIVESNKYFKEIHKLKKKKIQIIKKYKN